MGIIDFFNNLFIVDTNDDSEIIFKGIFFSGGLIFVLMAHTINYLSVDDFYFIGNFKSVGGWDLQKKTHKFLSFEVKENEVINLGDIDITLRVKGGEVGEERRSGLIDVNLTNELAQDLKKKIELKELKIKNQKPNLGYLIGEFGAGEF